MTSKALPTHLHIAYEWLAAAGELDRLMSLTLRDAGKFITACLRNYKEQADPSCGWDAGSLTRGDMLSLRTWLRSNR